MTRRYPLPQRWTFLLRGLKIKRAGSSRRETLSTSELFELLTLHEENLSPGLLPLLCSTFDPSLFAALCCDNLRGAFLRLQAYSRLMLEQSVQILEADGNLTLSLDWTDTVKAPPANLIWWELAFYLKLARYGTGLPLRPQLVGSPYFQECPACYLDFFGVKPVPHTLPTLVFSSSDVKHRFFIKPKDISGPYRPFLRPGSPSGLRRRMEIILLGLLPSGRSRIQDICSVLKQSQRSVQRQLKLENTCFRTILKETRQQLSDLYLSHEELYASEIAFLLGYDDTSSFSRAHKSWTGKPPRDC